ncbi:hypothetical protein [Spongorhabdus nitratireducens]
MKTIFLPLVIILFCLSSNLQAQYYYQRLENLIIRISRELRLPPDKTDYLQRLLPKSYLVVYKDSYWHQPGVCMQFRDKKKCCAMVADQCFDFEVIGNTDVLPVIVDEYGHCFSLKVEDGFWSGWINLGAYIMLRNYNTKIITLVHEDNVSCLSALEEEEKENTVVITAPSESAGIVESSDQCKPEAGSVTCCQNELLEQDVTDLADTVFPDINTASVPDPVPELLIESRMSGSRYGRKEITLADFLDKLPIKKKTEASSPEEFVVRDEFQEESGVSDECREEFFSEKFSLEGAAINKQFRSRPRYCPKTVSSKQETKTRSPLSVSSVTGVHGGNGDISKKTRVRKRRQVQRNQFSSPSGFDFHVSQSAFIPQPPPADPWMIQGHSAPEAAVTIEIKKDSECDEPVSCKSTTTSSEKSSTASITGDCEQVNKGPHSSVEQKLRHRGKRLEPDGISVGKETKEPQSTAPESLLSPRTRPHLEISDEDHDWSDNSCMAWLSYVYDWWGKPVRLKQFLVDFIPAGLKRGDVRLYHREITLFKAMMNMQCLSAAYQLGLSQGAYVDLARCIYETDRELIEFLNGWCGSDELKEVCVPLSAANIFGSYRQRCADLRLCFYKKERLSCSFETMFLRRPSKNRLEKRLMQLFLSLPKI